MSSNFVDVLVIGGGVIGLAIAKSFHESLNYKNVGFQFTENNTKKVSLMVKNI